MRTASLACLALAVCLAALAGWGLFSAAGQRAYDEMAGIIPFAAGALSPVLLLAAIVAGWRARRAARRDEEDGLEG